jgi:hypothetical protein
MGYIRTHADHVEIKASEKLYVSGKIRECLTGDAHHDPAANFKTDFSDSPDHRNPVRGHAGQGRVNAVVQHPVGSFETKQISIGTRFPPGGKLFIAPLPKAQGYGKVRFVFDLANDLAHPVLFYAVIFSALKHDCAVTEFHRQIDTGHYFILGHPVTPDFMIVRAYAAVSAVAGTYVRNFDQAAQIHFLPNVSETHFVRPLPQLIERGTIFRLEPSDNFISFHMITILSVYACVLEQ